MAAHQAREEHRRMWGGGEGRRSEKGLCFRHIKTESLLDVQVEMLRR